MANGLFGGGIGTEQDPFLIEDAMDLDAVRNNLAASYKQTADIDLSTWGNWVPIGPTSDNYFEGGYDGTGHSILNLTIDNEENDNAMFRYCGGGATFQNIHLVDVNITGGYNTAALISYTHQNHGTIFVLNCSASGVVHCDGGNGGGLIGCLNLGTVKDSHSTCTVTGSDWDWGLGGFIGFAGDDEALVQRCYATGDVSIPQGGWAVGGLIAETGPYCVITECFATGNVSADGYVGGLVGYNSADISHCYSRGNVTSDNSSAGCIGGLLGVSFADGEYADKTRYCYTAGTVSADPEAYDVGAFIGDTSGGAVLVSCYYDMDKDTSEYGDDLATAATTAEMTYPTAANTYEGWDFTGTWNEDESYAINSGYPYLGDEIIILNGPIPISSAQDLDNIRHDSVNRFGVNTEHEGYYIGGLDKEYFQTANIDLTGLNWDPIGAYYHRLDNEWNFHELVKGFTGVYDGRGHKIENLTIVRTQETTIQIDGIEWKSDQAGLFGRVEGQVKGVNVQGTIEINYIGGMAFAGGIVGHSLGGVFIDCSADVAISGTRLTAGGFAGDFLGNVSSSYAKGNVLSNTQQVGGFLGRAHRGSIITDCYSRGNVETTYNHASNARRIGGFAGSVFSTSGDDVIVSNSYSTGSITYTGVSTGTGGFWGQEWSHLLGSDPVIGVQFYYCYYDTETSGQSDTGKGEPRTTEEMTYIHAANTYEGWDFTGTWNEDESYAINSGYPYLGDEIIILNGPIPISSVQDLDNIRHDDVNRFGVNTEHEGYYIGGLDKEYFQTADIDLAGLNWEPIGAAPNNQFQINNQTFAGSYNGNGFKITNLNIHYQFGPQGILPNVGLFAMVGGVIENVTIENAVVNSNVSAGILAGEISNRFVEQGTRISRCSVSGDIVTDDAWSWGVSYGGLACGIHVDNENHTLIEECSANVNISISSTTTLFAVGGLAAWSYIDGGSVDINDCYAFANVHLDTPSTTQVGGLVADISDWASEGSYTSIKNCYAVLSVESVGVGDLKIGGIVEDIASWSKINDVRIIGCYYNSDTLDNHEVESNGGIPRTTEEMTYPSAENTYEGWLFNNVWFHDEDYTKNNGYPTFYIAAEEEQNNGEYSYQLSYEMDRDTLLSTNTLRIEYWDQHNLYGEPYEDTFLFGNDPPEISSFQYWNKNIFGTITDPEEDKVIYRILVNGKVIKNWESPKQSPLSFYVSIDDDLLREDKNNYVLIQARDVYGGSDNFLYNIGKVDAPLNVGSHFPLDKLLLQEEREILRMLAAANIIYLTPYDFQYPTKPLLSSDEANLSLNQKMRLIKRRFPRRYDGNNPR